MPVYHRVVLCRIGDQRFMLNPTYHKELAISRIEPCVVWIGKHERTCFAFKIHPNLAEDRLILSPRVSETWESVGACIKVTGIRYMT